MNDTTSNQQHNDPFADRPGPGADGCPGGQTGSSYGQPGPGGQTGSSYGQPGPGGQTGSSYGQPYGGQQSAQRTPTQGFFGWIRGLNLVRTTDRWFGGVAAGMAHKLGMEPWVMRLVMFLLISVGGVSLWFYLLAWVLLPDQSTGSIPLQRLIS